MGWLRRVIEEQHTVIGKLFTLIIQLLIVGSLVAIGFETLPNLSEEHRGYLEQFELYTVIVFTVEYLLRLLVAERKRQFVFSFLGLIDLVAILPFYITTGLDLRVVRAFRLFRLIRIFKLMRFNKAAARFSRALTLAREELILFLVTSLILVFVSAVGIYYCERNVQPEHFKSVFHSLWWAVATLTTVGYVDVYPVTLAGKALTVVILLLGPGFLIVPSGLLASALSEARHLEREEAKAVTELPCDSTWPLKDPSQADDDDDNDKHEITASDVI